MSWLRFFREAIMLIATVGGAVIGYSASVHLEPAVNMTCAFLGMALLGAFVDICIRGGK